MVPVVRPPAVTELPQLGEIERAADTLFEPLGIVFQPGSVIDEVSDPGKVLVVGDPPVAFAYADRLDTRLHLHQIAVHPAHVRTGIGSALMAAVIGRAGSAGVTLTTFRDVPWNGPWYARLGFVELADPGPDLAALVAAERDLAELGPRVVLYRTGT
ncbi:GNAT family N-acetyltransferase [Actinocrispum wychmicini]|uniref:Acetyltransferase (GNAT) family protein n=1 Tax=Actinocrispum wychmicini TaxID=1213861 RepID=A0A4R2J4B4_9PSEU|nr:GNAT family N-acetyltransferase [Actinocrispum wychmicini]TCO52587.1 acetyltransferase (GNAT) family protein [Actinocrispum wychmicini]